VTTILVFIESHWIEGVAWAIAGAAGWLIINTVAKPLLAFWDDRQRAIENLRTDGATAWNASEDRVFEARRTIRQVAARLAYYAEGGAAIVRIYCRVRHYDLNLADNALRGLAGTIGNGVSNELFGRQTDAVRVCLGATRAMSSERVAEIQLRLREAPTELEDGRASE